jgi:hypothetical protein
MTSHRLKEKDDIERWFPMNLTSILTLEDPVDMDKFLFRKTVLEPKEVRR